MVSYLKALETASLWEWQLPDQLVYKKLFITGKCSRILVLCQEAGMKIRYAFS